MQVQPGKQPICFAAMYMWQSQVENIHYFASVKKWVNCANQVFGASPASCASTSAIRCQYEQLCPWKSFDLRALHRLRTRYSGHTVKFGKIQRLVSPVLQQLQTQIKHQQWDGSLVKTEATLKQNRWAKHTHWVPDRCNTDRQKVGK